MKNNELLHKFANNKKLLYLTPHLIYINTLLTRYILNKEIIFFENLLLLILLFITITTILQLVLKIILKKEQYVFYITVIISLLYMHQINLIPMIIFLISSIVALVTIICIFKKYINTLITIVMFIILAYFFLTTPQNIFSIIVNGINTKFYNETHEISVSEETLTPNIYWIHTDATMSFDTIQKYFSYNNHELKKYLTKEGFQTNESASMVVGHRTQPSLAALFNPNYYDEFLKDYFNELEEVYLEKKESTSYNISTKELAYKRIENELLNSLKEKDYTTIAISKLNNYSYLNTDIFYDYNNQLSNHWHFPVTQELRKVSKESLDNISINSMAYQFKEMLIHTIFNKYANQLIPYDYELVDYNTLDTSDYKNIDNTVYWQIKAILKGIEETKKIESNKFLYIDYDLNHSQIAFDLFGNILSQDVNMNTDYYIGNYIYSCKLLIEMIDYIKTNDSEAIIIIQADHGIHAFEDSYLKEKLNINIEQVQEMRNSVMNAIYIPEKYQNGDEKHLNNPLNISRYLVNNYVGKNYEYLEC